MLGNLGHKYITYLDLSATSELLLKSLGHSRRWSQLPSAGVKCYPWIPWPAKFTSNILCATQFGLAVYFTENCDLPFPFFGNVKSTQINFFSSLTILARLCNMGGKYEPQKLLCQSHTYCHPLHLVLEGLTSLRIRDVKGDANPIGHPSCQP